MAGPMLDKLIAEIKNGFFKVKPDDATAALEEIQARFNANEAAITKLQATKSVTG